MIVKKKFARLIADVAIETAVKSAGNASRWTKYQPKEPEELEQYVKIRRIKQ